ncbi:MAG: hypothetical protein ACRC1K_23010 [Planctomycetia bacterium]
MTGRCLSFAVATCILAGPLTSAEAADGPKPASRRQQTALRLTAEFVPNDADELFRRLVDVELPKQPLEKALDGLAAEHRLLIVRDPRVDPFFEVYGGLKRTPLESVVDRLVGLAGAHALPIGEVLLVGPRETADQCATAAALLYETLPTLKPADRAALLARVDVEWSGAEAVPVVLERVMEGGGWTFATDEVLDAVPPKTTLKSVRRLDAAAALLATADAVAELDPAAKVLRGVNPPAKPLLKRRVSVLPPKAKAAAADMMQAAPGLVAEADGATVAVSGPVSAMRALERYRRSAAESPTGKGTRPATVKRTEKQVFTLTMRNTTLEKFVETLAKQTGRAIEIDEESLDAVGKGPLDRLSCSVENVSLEELLSTTLEPAGLSFRATGGKIVLFAKPEAAQK